VTFSYLGATTTVIPVILDQNGSPLTGTVTWLSDAPQVATVTAAGVVTAVANGSTTVRAASGNLSATVAVTVQQTVATLTVVSGDGQSAVAGQSLAEAVAVRARDQGGAGVQGATVTFTPDPGSGVVSATSATTDAEGSASTVWTLGEAFGPQRLTVTAGPNASAVLAATSRSPVPLPDLVTGGTLIVQRPDPSSLDTVTVQATVRNDGDAETGQGVRVRLLADGQEIAASDIEALGPGAQETLTFTAGPFAVGTRTLRLEVDPGDAIEELLESNNTLVKDVPVVLESLVEPGATLTGLGASEDVELLYRLDLPLAANNLTVELSGGTGDVDLFVEKGERPSSREAYNDCQSGSPTTAERCQLVGVTAGPYHILLHAFSTFSGTTMTITLDGEVLPFNIEVVFIDHGTASQDAAVTQAAERWMSLIPVDLPDSDFSTNPYPAGECLEGQPAVADEVDDIRIYVSIKTIDGVSGTLAQATPCVARGLGNLPLLGYMEFDQDDLGELDTSGELFSIVLHEMGHVLGLGTIWSASGLLQNPSRPSNPGADTHFSGPQAVAAFDAAGGTGYTQGQKVPVENTAEEGSADGHWRESVLGRELMTPFFNRGRENPMSAISVRALADLGYQVDANQADPFTGAFSAPSPAPGSEEPIMNLMGDVAKRPVVAVDQKGRIMAVRR
jgi:hypothetical protein